MGVKFGNGLLRDFALLVALLESRLRILSPSLLESLHTSRAFAVDACCLLARLDDCSPWLAGLLSNPVDLLLGLNPLNRFSLLSALLRGYRQRRLLLFLGQIGRRLIERFQVLAALFVGGLMQTGIALVKRLLALQSLLGKLFGLLRWMGLGQLFLKRRHRLLRILPGRLIGTVDLLQGLRVAGFRVAVQTLASLFLGGRDLFLRVCLSGGLLLLTSLLRPLLPSPSFRGLGLDRFLSLAHGLLLSLMKSGRSGVDLGQDLLRTIIANLIQTAESGVEVLFARDTVPGQLLRSLRSVHLAEFGTKSVESPAPVGGSHAEGTRDLTQSRLIPLLSIVQEAPMGFVFSRPQLALAFPGLLLRGQLPVGGQLPTIGFRLLHLPVGRNALSFLLGNSLRQFRGRRIETLQAFL